MGSARYRWDLGLRPALSRLLPRGLRWRLTAWVAVVLLVSSAITFVAIYRGTGSQLRKQTDHELAADGTLFVHRLEGVSSGGAAQVSAVGGSYVNAQPFGASSRLLFAVVPGAATVSNEPELLGSESPDHHESVAVQDAENRLAHALLRAPVGYSTVEVPDVGALRLLIETVPAHSSTVAGKAHQQPRIGVGEPLVGIDRAQESVLRTFLLAGAIVLILALLASYLVGARMSRPLRRMARIATRVDGGDLAPRIGSERDRDGLDRDRPDGGSGDEVQVLAHAFDHMLDRLADAFARQRSFISDASHELRTPLTVIRGQLEVLGRQQHPDPHEVRRVERLVAAEVARMSRLVDELLLLAHSDEGQFVELQELALGDYVRELWHGIGETADRRFELSLAVEGTLRADPDRLAQALRNLVRNAIEHTHERSGRVRLGVSQVGPSRLRFAVEDDGEGIAPDQREQIFNRFHRTDDARDRAQGGAGLGLAIVKAIAEAHGGRVKATHSRRLGGARLELEIPGLSKS